MNKGHDHMNKGQGHVKTEAEMDGMRPGAMEPQEPKRQEVLALESLPSGPSYEPVIDL